MSEIFEELCPVYMFYGMTYDEFWTCEPQRYIAYKEVHRLGIKRRNEELWLQGLYNFRAISTALSNIHLDGKSHQINKYMEEPFDLFANNRTEKEEQQEKEKAKQKVIDQLNAFKARWEAKKGKR